MLEFVYTSLLVIAIAAAGLFSFYVVAKLFKGQG
jgi:hypothetical protein